MSEDRELTHIVAKIKAQCDVAPGPSTLIMVSKAHILTVLAARASPPAAVPTGETQDG